MTFFARAKWDVEHWIERHDGERVLDVTHTISEYAKRAYCAVFGHRVELDQDSWTGDYDTYCERCCDEGNFDGLTRIPNQFAWWLQDRVVGPIAEFFARDAERDERVSASSSVSSGAQK